jgi:aminoglycoside phosphotransferase (APT) family kinase protein
MTESRADSRFEAVVHRLDPYSTLLRAWLLRGGVSAQVTALEIKRADGRIEKLVVRLHGPTDLAHNPQIAADEFKLLQIMQAAGAPAPRPYFFDQSGAIFATPYIVIEYIEGATQPAPGADPIPQLAERLAQIHRIDGAQAELSFLPRQAQRYADMLRAQPSDADPSCDEARMRRALEPIWPLAPRNGLVLLHGDFWPGNMLWQNDRLVAVIDWEDAAVGDPLADLANSRLELLWAFGADAMQRFTQRYHALAAVDLTQLPYWELGAALRRAGQIGQWGLDERAERTMREQLRWFIEQAFQTLAMQSTA